ncbi:hypothetical protein E2R51_10465 [Jeotgalibacillus sp. S-D1]|uniref:hypothetical protein n=1 Tax=Jeotgalibacillus sp. S-D1 TaxID=2552189 RepID=UPI00105A139E|nr:hypothetical protein [Jeotgalibacillus sp. S-D1]TDL33071.1 hypothetical protein E2R51_10465 [Jeotgalibacillus sp. S-D1]
MKNSKAAILLWSSQVFYLLFIPVWFAFFGLTMMMTQEEQQLSVFSDVLVYMAGAYPVVLIFTIAMSWTAYHKKNWKKMIITNSLPILWIAPILLTFLIANFL